MHGFAHKHITVGTPTPLDTVNTPPLTVWGRLAPPRAVHALLHVGRRLLRSASCRSRVTHSLQGDATPRDRRRWQKSVYRVASGLCSHARTAHQATRQTANEKQDWRRSGARQVTKSGHPTTQSPTWSHPRSHQSKNTTKKSHVGSPAPSTTTCY